MDQGHSEGLRDGQASAPVEEGRVAHQTRPAETLGCPGETGDFGAPEVDAAEAVEIGGAGFDPFLEGIGIDNHGDCFVGVEAAGVCVGDGKTSQGPDGVFVAVLADQPPGALGGEPDANEDGDWPGPLDGKGDAVGPFVCAGLEALEDARGDELAEDPAEVDIGGQVCADGDGADLGGVGDSEGLVHAQRNPHEQLASDEGADVGCEEEDEDEAHGGRETGHQGAAVSKALRDDAVDEEADDLAAGHGVGHGCLPFGVEAVLAVGHDMAILLVERRVGEERADQDDVVALHDDGARHEQRPADGLAVDLEGLEGCHAVLLVEGSLGLAAGDDFMPGGNNFMARRPGCGALDMICSFLVLHIEFNDR